MSIFEGFAMHNRLELEFGAQAVPTLCFLLFAALFCRPLAGDEVITVNSNGKETRRRGTILEYKGQELTLRVGSRNSKIDSDRIKRITAEWTPEHQQASELFESRKYSEALNLYRQAFPKEKRQWVQRLILSQVIRCELNIGRVESACKNFSRLIKNDPETGYLYVIPLAWPGYETSGDVARRVRPWLSDSQQPALQLVAASWLLASDEADCLSVLRELGRREELPEISKLAVLQMLRVELRTLKKPRLKFWSGHVDGMPTSLRAGGYYMLGQAHSKFGETDESLLALLRMPSQYPHASRLTMSALLSSGAIFEKQQDKASAAASYRRLIELYPSSESAQATKEKLRVFFSPKR